MSNKSKKKSSSKPASKVPQKKANFLPFFAVVAVVICAAVVFMANGNKSNDANDEVNIADTVVPTRAQAENGITDHAVNGAVTIAYGESLTIPTTDITTDASFFPVEVDGTAMEVVAVRDSTEHIRTAFNTCQVCYDSGRGYYVQSGDYLVCQTCGNRFAMDQVEIESGGCNPWPIFDENKTVTEDEISISYDFLVEAQGIFSNWKGNY